MKTEHRNILLYIAKAITGTVLLYVAAYLLQINDISWVLISTLLVLTPDSSEALPLTIVRVKANLIASAVTCLFLLICPQTIAAICLAIAATIILCYLGNLMAGSRVALAAVIIIAHHPSGGHLWTTALERVLSVFIGCGLGLLLTYAFHRSLPVQLNLFGKDKDLGE